MFFTENGEGENLEHNYEGWKIGKELTNHSAPKDIETWR